MLVRIGSLAVTKIAIKSEFWANVVQISAMILDFPLNHLIKQLFKLLVEDVVRRIVLFFIGCALLILGLITVPTPFPLGIVLIPTGLALLMSSSKTFRRWILNLRQRYAIIDRPLRSVQNNMPKPIRKSLESSTPRNSHPPKG